MTKLLQALQIFTAVIMIISILLQQKGSGLSGVFGGEGSTYRTKRGAERFLFWTTIVASVIFFSATLLSLILSSK